MIWRGETILVTGAGGFIGSHLVERLVALGAHVRAFVRYNSRNDWGLIEDISPGIRDEMEIVVGDLKDSWVIRNAVEGVGIVFHLGALIAIPYSYVNPGDVVQTNVIGTLNILNACRESGVGKFVHTSTSEVYGTAKYVPMDEDHPLQAQSPYAASKIGADKLAESFHLSYDLPVATIRPFNTYGPRQSARAVIPTIITQVLTKDKILLGALHPIRDFTYVKDTVEGFIEVAGSPESVGQVINIGSGKGISIGDLAQKVISLTGKNVQIVSDEARIRPKKSEVNRLLASNSKAKQLLQWEPKVSLDEGLLSTIDWVSKHIGNYKADVYNR